MHLPRRIRLALLGLVCWLPFAACMCGPGAPEDSPQGKTLTRMKTAGRKIVPRLEGEANLIEFGAIEFGEGRNSVPWDNRKTVYADLPYNLTSPQEAAFGRLFEVVRKSHPDATHAAYADVRAKVSYTDQNDETLDSDSVSFRLWGKPVASSKEKLPNLGKSGAPTAAVVRLESVRWNEDLVAVAFPTPPAVSSPVGEQSRTPLMAPPGLPFTLEFLNIDGERPSSKLHWQRTGDEAALKKLLPESKVAALNRPAAFATITVTAFDTRGQAIDKASTDIQLPLEGSVSGSHALYRIALTAPLTLKVELKSLTWPGRSLEAKF